MTAWQMIWVAKCYGLKYGGLVFVSHVYNYKVWSTSTWQPDKWHGLAKGYGLKHGCQTTVICSCTDTFSKGKYNYNMVMETCKVQTLK